MTPTRAEGNDGEQMAKIDVTDSSGNVFTDLGLEDAKELEAKAALALHIKRIIKRRALTQVQASKQLGIPQTGISRLLNGELGRFSMQQLLNLTMNCDRDIEIIIKRRPGTRKESRLSVRAT